MSIDEQTAASALTEEAPAPPWRDASLAADVRAEDLIGRLSLEEKVAQLYGVWVGATASGEDVAPHQHDLAQAPEDWDAFLGKGLGQLTRVFGTAPVDPALGARALAHTQADIVAASRHGIPAVAHEECLAGFTTWGATIYPVPLCWGATFDPGLVEQMAARIGAGMRAVGVHQGLAPVLDVTRDYRWGRVEETIGEDPYLVGTIATAYVRGLQSAGVIATLKHFVGYSASKAGRNLAPVSAGPREVADVLLPPFEMAVREGGARSVMHSYSDVDGVPAAADERLLTGLLRDEWGFTGTVVADYFGVSFLELLHRVAADEEQAAALALAAGVDVELPTVRCYGEPLLAGLRAGRVDEALVDRAVRRVLVQKAELGLLDADWSPVPPALADRGVTADALDAVEGGTISLDPAEDRELARAIAERSIVLLRDEGPLPLPASARIAVVGPRADDPLAMMGCYSFPSHVLDHHPDVPLGLPVPTLLEALRAELPGAQLRHVAGCDVDGPDVSGIPAAVAVAEAADVVVVALGDRAGLFGRGTSGEGCDVADLTLPGVQGALLDALLGTGTPVVLVLLTGRPYALGAYADRAAAVLQAFFPGEEGGPALAGLLSGRVAPSGRLPVSIPRDPGASPGTYLAAPLAARSDVSNLDPTALYPFGFGLSGSTFAWTDVTVDDAPLGEPVDVRTDGSVTVRLTVRNTGDRAAAEIVQLYLHDPVAQVTRPDVRLVGYARVELAPEEQCRIALGFSADLASFPGVDLHRVVEPGDLELRLATSSRDVREVVRLRLTGPVRRPGGTRALTTTVEVSA